MVEGIAPWLLKILQIKRTVFISLVFQFFGPGCAKEIGGKAQNLGAKKALIVTDAGLFKFGVADTIAGYLKMQVLIATSPRCRTEPN